MEYLDDILLPVAPIVLGLVIERVKGEGKTWMDAGNIGSDLGLLVMIVIGGAGLLLASFFATRLSAYVPANFETAAYWAALLVLGAIWLYAVFLLTSGYLEQSGPVQTGLAIATGLALDNLLAQWYYVISCGLLYAGGGALLGHFVASGLEFGFGLSNGYLRAVAGGAAGMIVAGVLIALFGPPMS